MRRPLLILWALLAACDPLPRGALAPPPDPAKDKVNIVARTPSMKTYPCVSLCHFELVPNPEPRTLTEFHVGRVLEHGPALTFCNWCHKSDDFDRLSLLDGTKVPFDESYKLCGQCHGDKLRDWKVGVHGKQVGHWNGPKDRYLCAHCHDPHKPKFPAIKALPPPMKPGHGPGGTSSHAL